MIAIIAEKPSVGQDIARVVGATEKMDGYITGNGYMVTWALGHLVSLALPGTYGYTRTTAEDLPMIPEPFRLVPRQIRTDRGMVTDIAAGKQLKIIDEVFSKCDSIIVATDAGRERELIFRWIYSYLGYTKPFRRLWETLTEEQKASVIAIVFHAGHHENDASDYSATGIGQQKCHGYAVALQDATNGYCQWGVYGTELGCCPTDGSGNKQNNYSTPDIDWSGYAWTQKIITAAGGKDKLNATEDSGYPATYYAVVDYAHKVPSPANSTGWFLPSIGQMWNVYQNRASLFEGKTVVSGLKSDWYWSSSEFCDLPASGALYVSVSGGNVYNYSKDDRNSYVRPVLAF